MRLTRKQSLGSADKGPETRESLSFKDENDLAICWDIKWNSVLEFECRRAYSGAWPLVDVS
jgi:hypothetical protein